MNNDEENISSRRRFLRKGLIAGVSAIAAGSMFVYHGERKAVLINYPEKRQLETIIFTNQGNS